jgi:hypothetical protein
VGQSAQPLSRLQPVQVPSSKESDMNARYRWLIGCLIAATTIIAGCGKHRLPRESPI